MKQKQLLVSLAALCAVAAVVGCALRGRGDILRFARSTEHFPLTLTLSLREREQQDADLFLADGRWANSGTGVIERRWTILPLPKGEGRGEGEPSVAQPTVQTVRLRQSLGIRHSDFVIPSPP